MNVLDFMASNGLVANKTKTEFLLLNNKEKGDDCLNEINVGDQIVKRTDFTKLLGVQIDAEQDWQEHIGKLKSGLNSRLFIIRRVARQIPKNKTMNIVHSLWISKLCYGLQLFTKVVVTEEERRSASLKSLQLTQNRLLRALNNTRIKDRISIKSMLEKFGLLSVNQLAAQIKLLEVWKSINVEGNPTKLEPYCTDQLSRTHTLRPKSNRIFNDTARLEISKSSFNIDAARLWNGAPPDVQAATSLESAKRSILNYVKKFPI